MENKKRESSKIIIGTSGYSYKEWKGIFYPPNINSSKFLEYYSTIFQGVEINYTFYTFPSPIVMEKITTQTPEDFSFSIKAHKTFTHERENVNSNTVSDFLHSLSPLTETHKLRALLLQFPYSFHYTPTNRYYLADILDKFASGIPPYISLAVEFRNAEWQRESVFMELANRSVTYVNVDIPLLKNLPTPATTSATPKLGYIRFHGKNKDTWWSGDNRERYDYQYTEEELKNWINPIQNISQKSSLLLIFFNNHHRGNAPKNALMLKRLLNL